MKSKCYAGIGSRETPNDILKMMTKIAEFLSVHGYTLRSGGAIGADKAFENGANKKEIYYKEDATDEAMEYVYKYHPKPYSLGHVAKQLLARNTFQILGSDLKTPSDFVICWTKDGCESYLDRTKNSGGTGQAIEIASRKGIEVFNLSNSHSYDIFDCLLNNENSIFSDEFKERYLK